MTTTYTHVPRKVARRPAKISHITYGQMLVVMYGKTFTRGDLMDATGLKIVTARRLEQYLLRNHMIHIVGWADTDVARVKWPIFRLGPGENKPRPIVDRDEYNYRRNERRKAARAEMRALKLSMRLKR
jgi:hypothetical protein